MHKGLLISFEGPDGAGKTSIMKEIERYLKEELSLEVLTTREPGGVEISEKIRAVILDVNHTNMDPKTELLLYIAARRQHLVEKVRPALEAGKIVLMDRFIDSSVAYQGYGRNLNKEDIEWLNQYATDAQVPDKTLLFDVESEIGLARIKANQREVNRLDLEAVEMHQRVRQGYLELSEANPRFSVIDASRSFESVLSDAIKEVEKVINESFR